MSKFANAYKNESVVEVDGVDHVLRPTFAALIKMETATGKCLQDLLDDALAQKLMIAEVSAIIAILSEEGGNPIDQEALQQYFMANGTGSVSQLLAYEVLPRIVYGGEAYNKIILETVKDEVATEVQKKTSQLKNTFKSQPEHSD